MYRKLLHLSFAIACLVIPAGNLLPGQAEELEIVLASIGMDRKLSDAEQEERTVLYSPYLMQEGTVKDQLDRLFSSDEMKMPASMETLEKAGFTFVSGTHVLGHPHFPSTIFKVGATNLNISRAPRAALMRKVLSENDIKDIVVPHKALYHIPGKDTAFNDENYIVVTERFDLLNEEENKKLLKELSEDRMRHLLQFFIATGYTDGHHENVCFLRDHTTIVILDTEELGIVSRTLPPKLDILELASRYFDLARLHELLRREATRQRSGTKFDSNLCPFALQLCLKEDEVDKARNLLTNSKFTKNELDQALAMVSIEMIIRRDADFTARVRLLLEHGADAKKELTYDFSILCMAVKMRKANLVKLMLEFGANIDTVIDCEHGLSRQEIMEGHSETARVLRSAIKTNGAAKL